MRCSWRAARPSYRQPRIDKRRPAGSACVRSRPGDIGWVISQHGELYSREYGWDIRFESFVARIAADFVDQFDAARMKSAISRCVAKAGRSERLSCAFVVKQDDTVAKLRMVLLVPAARGLSIGKRLVRSLHRIRAAGRLPPDDAVD